MPSSKSVLFACLALFALLAGCGSDTAPTPIDSGAKVTHVAPPAQIKAESLAVIEDSGLRWTTMPAPSKVHNTPVVGIGEPHGGYLQAGDINGDTLPDLLANHNGEFYVAWNLGGGRFTDYELALFDISPGRLKFPDKFKLRDFTGDGISDLIIYQDRVSTLYEREAKLFKTGRVIEDEIKNVFTLNGKQYLAGNVAPYAVREDSPTISFDDCAIKTYDRYTPKLATGRFFDDSLDTFFPYLHYSGIGVFLTLDTDAQTYECQPGLAWPAFRGSGYEVFTSQLTQGKDILYLYSTGDTEKQTILEVSTELDIETNGYHIKDTGWTFPKGTRHAVPLSDDAFLLFRNNNAKNIQAITLTHAELLPGQPVVLDASEIFLDLQYSGASLNFIDMDSDGDLDIF